jgi:hypothetical protein
MVWRETYYRLGVETLILHHWVGVESTIYCNLLDVESRIYLTITGESRSIWKAVECRELLHSNGESVESLLLASDSRIEECGWLKIMKCWRFDINADFNCSPTKKLLLDAVFHVAVWKTSIRKGYFSLGRSPTFSAYISVPFVYNLHLQSHFSHDISTLFFFIDLIFLFLLPFSLPPPPRQMTKAHFPPA